MSSLAVIGAEEAGVPFFVALARGSRPVIKLPAPMHPEGVDGEIGFSDVARLMSEESARRAEPTTAHMIKPKIKFSGSWVDLPPF
ncbi:hypothetical protein LO772_30815 [Yinghuangia sp. ASG 101]|uniref:hypothetical protein n=1 Tax=Yinghuangia sp. ASG 101 TaxID=2896848 RepID=UPI001E36FC1B|nr:hypothetical protein [Yinghuangia sp. ASG 101]UGQ11150.1 hypothetical protein LO772_30815 [Yinghuangia sp. ASG 101]